MKNRKTTRRALFSSVISLILCCAMLVGTTFAWFTDEVTSGINTITAGNLDVELYHSDKEAPNGEQVTEKTILFDDVTLWEPGAVAYENFVVKNEGNLALKYQLKLNFANATDNGNGGTLVDVLKVAIIEGGFAPTNDRVEAQQLAYNHNLSSFVLEGELEANEDSKQFGVVIYWEPSDKDNAYNLNNREKDELGAALKPLTIELGAHLFATQMDYEPDSFGSDYDYSENVLATVNNVDDLRAAIDAATDAGTIYLEPGTYEVEYVITISGKQLNIVPAPQNANSRSVGGVNIIKGQKNGSHLFNIADGSKIVFDGITMDGMGLRREGVYVRNNATVTLRNSSIKNTGGLDIMIDEGSDAKHGLNTTSTVNLENSSVEDVAACAAPVTSVAADQDTYVHFNFDARSSVGSFEKQSITKKPQNIYVNGDNGVAVASDAATIKAAIEGAKDGETVYIGAGSYTLDSQITIDNKSVTVVGIGDVTLNGPTGSSKVIHIRNAFGGAAANVNMAVTIKNVNFVNNGTSAAIWVRNDTDLTLEDVTVFGVNNKTSIQVENYYEDECADGIATITAKNVVGEKVTLAAAADHTTYFNYENSQFEQFEIQNLGGKVIINGAEATPGYICFVKDDAGLKAAIEARASKIYMSAGNYSVRFTNNTDFNVDNMTIIGEEGVNLSVSSSEVWYGRVQGDNVTFENIHFTSSVGATGKATYNNCTFDDWTICASGGNKETYFNNCDIKGTLNTSVEFSSGNTYVTDSTVAKAEFSGAATMYFTNCQIGELISWDMNTVLKNCVVEKQDLKMEDKKVTTITTDEEGLSWATNTADPNALVLNGVSSDYAGDTIVVPEGVTGLGSKALQGNTTIKEVEIPSTLTDFSGVVQSDGKGASGGFFYKSAVEKVVLPDGMTEIPAATFNQAANLKEVNIPTSVNTIGVNAFAGCGLEELTIPATVTSIGYGAFRDMDSLTTVTIEGDAVTLPGYVFRDCSALRTVYLNMNTLILNGSQNFANASSNNPGTNNITFYCKNYAVADAVLANMGTGSYVAIYVNGTLYAEIK